MRVLSGSTSFLLAGLAIFALAASGAVSVLVLHATLARTLMIVGISALMIGVAITIAAISVDSITVFFVGSIVAGIGFGGGFQGAIRTVLLVAQPHERAGLLSTIYVVS